MPLFLKPLIGFATSTSLLTSLMVLFSHGLASEGLTKAAIAERLGISERSVFRVLAG